MNFPVPQNTQELIQEIAESTNASFFMVDLAYSSETLILTSPQTYI
jgi:hypothetical protein